MPRILLDAKDRTDLAEIAAKAKNQLERFNVATIVGLHPQGDFRAYITGKDLREHGALRVATINRGPTVTADSPVSPGVITFIKSRLT